MFTFTKLKNKNGGFTLVELLIVIAIIGVLAATVVVSLGSQTNEARKGSVKIGVSSIRNLATVTVVEGVKGSSVCDDIYPKVSGEKSGWDWGDGGNTQATLCLANEAGGNGEICCAGDKEKWVVWGQGDAGEVYCADSDGYAGSFALLAGGNEKPNVPSVEEGDSTATPTKCRK